VRHLLLCAALLVLAPACSVGGGGEEEQAVVTVGERTISEGEVERALEHFREESEREGREFPEEDAPGFERARDQIVGLLVYRAQIAEGARRLGVQVSDDEVERRAERAREGEGEEAEAEGEEGEEAEEYIRDTVRSQLQYVAAYREVTDRVVVGDPEIAAYYRKNHARFGDRPLRALRATLAAELLQIKRTRAMNRWVARTQRQFPPRYEEDEE